MRKKKKEKRKDILYEDRDHVATCMCVCIYSIYVCVRAGAFDYGKAIDVIAIYVKTIINRLNCIERPRYRKETWTVSRSSSSNVVPRTTPFSTKLLRESMALKSAFEVDKKKKGKKGK